MPDRWHTAPHPDHRSSEQSGDFRGRRTNGRLSPLAKTCLGGAVALLIAFITGVSAWAWTQVSGDATFGKEGVIALHGRADVVEMRVDHVEETQKKLLAGQKDIIKLLFIRPGERKRSDLDTDLN